MADFVGSTAQMLDFAKQTDAKTLIIGTEMGMLHQLKRRIRISSSIFYHPGWYVPI